MILTKSEGTNRISPLTLLILSSFFSIHRVPSCPLVFQDMNCLLLGISIPLVIGLAGHLTFCAFHVTSNTNTTNLDSNITPFPSYCTDILAGISETL